MARCIILKTEPSTPAATPQTESCFEHSAWQEISGIWQPLHGGIFSRGFSLEWHDFHLNRPLDWARSFHEETLEICLNFGGRATFGSGKREQNLEGQQLAIYGRDLSARRTEETMHRFFTLEVTPEFLFHQFGGHLESLQPEIVRFMEKPRSAAGLLGNTPFPTSLLPLRMHLLEPPVFPSAQPTWYQGKVLEILSATLFRENKPAEMFCSQHKRLNRERVEHARFLLERDMEDPPSLELLAAEVGCSAFHLSRIFSQECGLSIPKYLRQRRIEKAAEILRSRSISVTDAAMAVGYSSLSAFIKAFVEHFGVLPSQYLNDR